MFTLGGLAGAAAAAPFTPSSDAQVLERLPARASDPRAREMFALREALRRAPQDLALAVELSRRYVDAVAAEGDPRYVGYIQAALQPWWNLPEPPVDVRVLRAIVMQFDHRFEPALADLDAALRADPRNAQAWSWRAAIHMVQANYAEARRSCDGLAPLAPPLIGVACLAQVDATTGRAAPAAAALRAALDKTRQDPETTDAQRQWALTRLAEIEERRGAFEAAETAFRAALALDIGDVYLQAAYADFLLDRGRAAEVLERLKDRGRADVLLLRLALAAQATGHPKRETWAAELTARFDAARQRGDTSHRKEEARFLRALRAPAALPQALVLARQNFAEQREPADARVLLEAALAARDPAAAEPALRWMSESHVESVALQSLAGQLKGLK